MAINAWILDTGSEIHVVNDRSRLFDVQPLSTGLKVVAGTGTCDADEAGSVNLKVRTPSGNRTITLKGVKYIPRFKDERRLCHVSTPKASTSTTRLVN
ncbi:uncharacterized protein Z519_11920 [Cladophialophora bantiana CBS 173.52]|uniref:Retrovirus-related Pol polyprotein from transposon TNT 1-94-like beta-barrel domain-containing protein n=1 Tax=Cladophialophora bantiana (strain ATCC 10958 / CBS 173.52 / CDC B-1940 / NIH 8579) TaxID=1442370 RepID=A0A0D2H9P5_CLAB1|nr:uncharacterized protein Z519_11920 [Cladophialophora bantiana CBS 173.52]KIW87595.1 hypothetical protein Z519_11920 [Cladophialophora bantiana CBS 173.52]